MSIRPQLQEDTERAINAKLFARQRSIRRQTLATVYGMAQDRLENAFKPERYDLIPALPLQQVAEIYASSEVYGWTFSKVFAKLLTHIYAWWMGHDINRATGKLHLAHAICCCFALLKFFYDEDGEDDRPKGVLR